jgi:hypothetical protein
MHKPIDQCLLAKTNEIDEIFAKRSIETITSEPTTTIASKSKKKKKKKKRKAPDETADTNNNNNTTEEPSQKKSKPSSTDAKVVVFSEPTGEASRRLERERKRKQSKPKSSTEDVFADTRGLTTSKS